MNNQIDYSNVMQPQQTVDEGSWEPPVHKFFGKKLPNGKMEPEPRYHHIPYPKMKYFGDDRGIRAKQVNTVQEEAALGESWLDSPEPFGFIGAPSFEQIIEMKEGQSANAENAESEQIISTAPRRGRPAKAD